MVNFMTRIIILVLLTFFSFTIEQSSARETGYKLAQGLKDNVVKVVGANTGFGFIAGQDEKGVYIVSAYHVLCKFWPCEEGIKIEVDICFHQNKDNCYPSEILFKSSKKDLVVMRAPLPPGQKWKKKALGSVEVLKEYRNVWYIGRKGEWSIPSIPGAFNRLDVDSKERLHVTDLKIKSGTSGAPLISEYGIVGMLLTQKGSDEPRALSVNFIKTLFRTKGFPWGLKQDPYADPLMAKAKKYYDFKLYKDAFETFKKAVEKGNTHAMTQLGIMCLHGEGTERSNEQAVFWFKKAVSSGDSLAMGFMGIMCEHGWGVAKDKSQALWWYKKAAANNEPEAMYMLALIYEHGRLGVGQDFNTAVKYYHRACKAGSIPARRKLAELGEHCD